MKKLLLYVLALVFASPAGAVSELSQSFSLDGELTAADHTTPLLDATAKVRVQILNPAKSCILYDEEQTVDTTNSNGRFIVSVGSATGSAKRKALDANLAMRDVYQNTSTVTGRTSGGAPCSYVPAAGDARYVRIIVTPTSASPETLSPDMVMNAVPTATVAQSVQGLERSGILQVNGGAQLTQSKLEELLTVFTSNTNRGVKYDGSNFTAFDPNAPTLAAGSVTDTAIGSVGWAKITSVPTALTQIAALSCVDGKILKRVSGAWACADDDNSGGGGGSPTGAAGGDLSGTYPNPSVAKIQNVAVSASGPATGQAMVYNGSQWAPTNFNLSNLKTVGGMNQFAAGTCSASQTLTWSAITDQVTCQNIGGLDLASSSVVTGALPIANGGTGATTATAALNNLLPSQSTNAGKVLQTDGTNASWVTPASGADNLGNHTATQNLNLATFKLVGNGGTVGINIDSTGKIGINSTSPAVSLDVNGNDAMAVPRGTTAQRPSSPVNGYIRYNSDQKGFEAYINGSWQQIAAGSSPGVSEDGKTLRWNNSTQQFDWFTAGAAGAGLANLNGSTVTTQSFAIGTSNNLPTWSTNTGTGVHTLHIPMANTASVTAGLISKAEYDAFNNKQPAGNYLTGLTGDVVATGPGSVSATIQTNAVTTGKINDKAVTYAKIQDVATNRLLGRATAGAGVAEEIQLGSGLNFTGTTLNTVNNGTVTGVTSGNSYITVTGTTAPVVTANVGTATNTLAAGDDSRIVGALQKSGGTMTGAINMGGFDITNTGNIAMAASKNIQISNQASDPSTGSWTSADKGRMWFNTTSNQLKYWDGSGVQILGVSGSGLTSLGGQNGSSQTFAAGAAGNAPAIDSSGNVHTLNVPLANAGASVTSGTISNADYVSFSGKLGAVSNTANLANNKIWIGDAGGKAQEQSVSGDISISVSGVTAVNKIKGIPVSATPTLAGQVLRYDGTTNFTPAFISMGDLRSQITGTTTLAASCSASQTLTYNSVGDNLTCSNIAGLNASVITAGTLGIANGGTGQTTASAAFNALSPMTTLGDTIYGGASGAGTRLAGNTTTTKMVLTQTGTGAVSAAPVWSALTISDLTSGTLAVANGGTGATSLTGYVKGNGTGAFTASATVPGADVNGNISGNAANVTGTVAIANGGTGQTSASAAFNALSPMTTLGDLVYGGASGAGTRLAGNITAGKQFLSQTGTGAISAAPVWASITAADVSNAVVNGGQAGAITVGPSNANALTLQTSGSPAVTVLSGGNVGVGTTNPGTKFEVNGTITSKVINVASPGGGFNWASGNIQYTATACSGTTWNFSNISEGTTYTLVVQGTSHTGTCAFSDGASTFKYSPTNATPTSGKDVIYSFMKVNSVVYVSWMDAW